MKIIQNCNEITHHILGLQKQDYEIQNYVYHKYIVEITDGHNNKFWHNIITNEIIKLDPGEELDDTYAIMNWWKLPIWLDPFSFAGTFKLLARNTEYFNQYYNLQSGEAGSLLILTTSGCNARCEYCFEQGAPVEIMTIETAEKIVQYLLDLKPIKPVLLEWFGGEPLCNTKVIDYVCGRCDELNIPYFSKIITNGYLVDEPNNLLENVEKWNMKGAQITLDGFGEDYNKVKKYVNPTTDPFIKVTRNIKNLLDKGVSISIRLNCTPYNYGTLHTTITFLADNIYNQLPPDCQGLMTVYTAPVYGMNYTEQETDQMYLNMMNLENYFVSCFGNCNIGSTVKTAYVPCSASLLDHVTVLPNGDFTNCDILLNNPDIIAGNLDDGIQINDEMLRKMDNWEIHSDGMEPACKDCIAFPRCWKIKKCMGKSPCIDAVLKYYNNSLELETIDAIRRAVY